MRAGSEKSTEPGDVLPLYLGPAVALALAACLAVSNDPIRPLEPRLQFVATTAVLGVVGAALLGLGRRSIYGARDSEARVLRLLLAMLLPMVVALLLSAWGLLPHPVALAVLPATLGAVTTGFGLRSVRGTLDA